MSFSYMGQVGMSFERWWYDIQEHTMVDMPECFDQILESDDILLEGGDVLIDRMYYLMNNNQQYK